MARVDALELALMTEAQQIEVLRSLTPEQLVAVADEVRPLALDEEREGVDGIDGLDGFFSKIFKTITKVGKGILGTVLGTQQQPQIIVQPPQLIQAPQFAPAANQRGGGGGGGGGGFFGNNKRLVLVGALMIAAFWMANRSKRR